MMKHHTIECSPQLEKMVKTCNIPSYSALDQYSIIWQSQLDIQSVTGLAFLRRKQRTKTYPQSSIEEAREAKAMEQRMQMLEQTESKRMRAIEALKSVLTRVSGVKLMNIDTHELESVIDIVAQVEVYGRAHTLACMLVSSDEPQQERESILNFCGRTLTDANNATPVLIAQRLSTDLQRLGRETKAGVLDLEGNARIELGETFIACQHMSQPEPQRKAPRIHPVKRSPHAGAAA